VQKKKIRFKKVQINSMYWWDHCKRVLTCTLTECQITNKHMYTDCECQFINKRFIGHIASLNRSEHYELKNLYIYCKRLLFCGVPIFMVFMDRLILENKNTMKYLYYSSLYSRYITSTNIRTNAIVFYQQPTQKLYKLYL
jgi:hypothetical protein